MAKSTFHYYIKKSKLPDKYQKEKDVIYQIFHEHKGRYGHRRITLEMKNKKYIISCKTVLKLMNQCNLKCMVRRKRYYSYKGEVGIAAANILNIDFTTLAPNRKWVTDISEFSICGQRLYFSPVMDLYNREIVCYTILDSPKLFLVTDMLNKAFEKLPDDANLILHSDQGWQYQHRTYREILRSKGIVQSMSRRGNCLDNAVMENFFGLLKSELLYLQEFESVEQFVDELNNYIDYYNNKRIKIHLNGLSPIQYRLQSMILNC